MRPTFVTSIFDKQSRTVSTGECISQKFSDRVHVIGIFGNLLRCGSTRGRSGIRFCPVGFQKLKRSLRGRHCFFVVDLIKPEHA